MLKNQDVHFFKRLTNCHLYNVSIQFYMGLGARKGSILKDRKVRSHSKLKKNRRLGKVINSHMQSIFRFYPLTTTVKPTCTRDLEIYQAYFHACWCIFRKLLFMLRKGLYFVKAIGYFSSYTIMVEVICGWSCIRLRITMDDKDRDPTEAAAYLCWINRTEMTIIGQNFAPKQKFDTKGPKVSESDGK